MEANQQFESRAARPVAQLSIELERIGGEVRAIGEAAPPVGQAGGAPRPGMPPAPETGCPQAFIEMQLARAAIIVQPVGDVGILLDLAEGDPGADGVNRARWNEVGLARTNRNPAQPLLDLSAQRRRPQRFFADRPREAEGDTRSLLRPQNVPHFRLADAALAVRMDLHGEVLRCE